MALAATGCDIIIDFSLVVCIAEIFYLSCVDIGECTVGGTKNGLDRCP